MPYTKTVWKNGASPGISADRMNNMEKGIEDAHTAIETMQPTVSSLQTRVAALEASLANDLRDNLFTFDFSSTAGLSIDAGWIDEQNGWLVIK